MILENLIDAKAPIVLTLFAAAVGWTTVRTADRLAATPFIEYRLEAVEPISPASQVQAVEVRFRNITGRHYFDCFNAVLAAPGLERTKFFGPSDQFAPVLRGSVLAQSRLVRAREHEWEFQFRGLGPGADIAVRVPLTAGKLPKLFVSQCLPQQSTATLDEASGRDSQDAGAAGSLPPVFVERSMQTWFVENEISVLWTAVLGWLLAMVVWHIVFSAKSSLAVRRMLHHKRITK